MSVCLFLVVGTCIVSGREAQTLGQELRDIPISLGDMAFNEGRNRGFDSQQVVTWEAKDIVVTTGGTFAAQFKTRYQGPPVPYPVVLDVLFVQVQAEYAPFDCPPGSVCVSDPYYEPLGEIVPLVAKHSAPRSARFIASDTFKVPGVTNPGSQLRTVWLNLTWVRVYDAGEQLGFHVFPGFARFYYPDIPRIGFDQEPQTITGRLGYYQVLLGRGAGGGLFNYQRWIRRYLNNR
ncbi:MAG TPA: hypothetical protein VI837_04075 [Blastocatellia bacterium]|nr:hypothetical protein [Blastocatellia bacterium]